jgi:decaprenyl-diphosphate synthase subunit 1
MAVLMAAACNNHTTGSPSVHSSQCTIAMISEMIHTASLIHDDVIDGAATRRGKPSVNAKWGEKMSVVTGDFILARSSMALARLGHKEVIKILATVIDDLVNGEIMQLKSVGKEKNDMFTNYLEKTYKKTATLMANSCKAVAILSSCGDDVCEAAYEYGRHTGLAFQLTDDMLDYGGSSKEFGKPTAIDLKLGLATAPVLYAADEFSELNEMINRKFSHEGDSQRALELVNKSSGLRRTHELAVDYAHMATKAIDFLKDCKEKSLLLELTRKCTSRTK